nr:extracellular calcium-sensing receptor-like isoform X2 [Paramormyrops kingsleyae]
MGPAAWLCLLCFWLLPARALEDGACWPVGGPPSGVLHRHGDVLMGGLFPVHMQAPDPDQLFTQQAVATNCLEFDLRSYRWLQTMIFAVEEINRSPALLPNLTLGYVVADSCLAEGTTLAAALALVTGQDHVTCGGATAVPVIIGDARSSSSIAIARTLSVFSIPLVSYFASCACLSDWRKYPTFLRTVPSDAFQRELQSSEVCLAFSELIPKSYSQRRMARIVDVIKRSSAQVVVTFGITPDMHALLSEVVKQNITEKQWIATEGWVTSSLLSAPQFMASLGGTIGFALRRGNIKGLWPFLTRLHPNSSGADPFVREFWEVVFECSLEDRQSHLASTRSRCSGTERLDLVENIYTDVSQLRVSNNVYKAVYAIAHALHNMLACQPGQGPFEDKRCPDVSKLQPWQLLHYLRAVNFTTPAGEEIHFDDNGDPMPSYDIINWHRGPGDRVEFVKVGQFVSVDGSRSTFEFDVKKVFWGGSQKEVPVSQCSAPCPPGTWRALQRGKPVCCFDCLPCADGHVNNQTGSTECMKCPERFWSNSLHTECVLKEVEFLSFGETLGVVLTVLSVTGAALTAAVTAVFFRHRDTPLVRANNSELSFLLLLALELCFLCALAFLGRPSAWSCRLRHTLFGISFVLCVSCVLSKTVVVLVAFRATLPGNNIMRYFGPAQQRMGLLFCTLIQVVICVVWLAKAPPLPSENTGHSPKLVLECDIGSALGFSLILGYIGLLAAVCFLLAFLARKLPDNFNEAKFITFSMIIFCAVWVAFVPAYISSPGKYTVAVEIFAILASSYGLLLCIFAPKCYMILLKPEKNTKKSMMAK